MVARRYLGELELLILLAIRRLGPEAYGVSIGRAIEAAGGRTVALGSIYASLERMEAGGLVASELGEATAERGGRAKRYFRMTAEGRGRLAEAQGTLAAMWQDAAGMA